VTLSIRSEFDEERARARSVACRPLEQGGESPLERDPTTPASIRAQCHGSVASTSDAEHPRETLPDSPVPRPRVGNSPGEWRRILLEFPSGNNTSYGIRLRQLSPAFCNPGPQFGSVCSTFQ
jgi:hypothetical protein